MDFPNETPLKNRREFRLMISKELSELTDGRIFRKQI